MIRKINESFESYKERRATANVSLKRRLKGRMWWASAKLVEDTETNKDATHAYKLMPVDGTYNTGRRAHKAKRLQAKIARKKERKNV